MKKYTRLIAILLAVTLSFSILPLSGVAASAALKGKTIIAFGDSLTAQGGSLSYPNHLGNFLDVPVINAGIGGETTEDGLKRFNTDVLSKDPDVVIICFGRNDQAHRITLNSPLVSQETYRKNLTYFAESLKEIGCDVVFVAPNPVLVGENFYPEGGGEYDLDYGYGHEAVYCNIMREVALATNSTYVDVEAESKYFDNTKLVLPDGLHHNDYGRETFAKYIYEHLSAVYDGTNKATMTVNCVDKKGKNLGSYTLVGKAGSNVIIPSPEIEGYTTKDPDIATVYSNGKTFTFTYNFELFDVVAEAMTLKHNDYGKKVIELVRETVAEANALLADDNPAVEDMLACSKKLKSLLAVNGTSNYILSQGASYTTTALNRLENDPYNDDGVRLTDGKKGTAGGGESAYAGWNSIPVEVIVDLGAVTKADYFSVYCASGMWGIKRPNNLTVSVSTDGTNYTTLGTETAVKNTIESKDGWDTSIISVITDTPVDARYVKFAMSPNGPHIWMDEVEVSLSPEKAYNGIYVTGINKYITANDCTIFTPDFGTITPEKANHKYTANAVAKWSDTENGYVVTAVSLGVGDATADITLAEDEILICAHSDEVDYISYANHKKVRDLKVGQVLTLDGIDIEGKTLDFAPRVLIEDYPEEEVIDGDVFWVTHFNDNSVEGAGSIFTDRYTGCEWWSHVAFKPVDGLTNVYEVVATSDAPNGGARPLDIPKGGFVWAVGTGNNYIEIDKNDDRLNYVSDGSKGGVALAKSMKIGDKYIFSGLNLDTREVPTSTPHIDYFAPEYECTARYAPYVEAPILSYGKDYTTTTPNRPAGDGYNDDGVRLTDGNKGNPNGGDGAYAGWGSTNTSLPNSVEVIVDLGEATYSDTYTVYLAGGNWGILLPIDVISIEVLVSDSADGEYKSVASAPLGSAVLINGTGIDNTSAWSTYTMTATAEKAVMARFVKFVVTHKATGNGNIWMDEVEVNMLGNSSTDPNPDPKPDPKPDPDPEVTLGDVNNDGVINQYDYILVKRHYFETRKLTSDELTRADVNSDDKVDQYDYILICRHYFGTYVIG